MELNIFTHKAVVLFNGIWQVVMGQKCNYDLYFLHNGRIEFATEGSWYAISYTSSDEAAETEAIRVNISDIMNQRLKR